MQNIKITPINDKPNIKIIQLKIFKTTESIYFSSFEI